MYTVYLLVITVINLLGTYSMPTLYIQYMSVRSSQHACNTNNKNIIYMYITCRGVKHYVKNIIQKVYRAFH